MRLALASVLVVAAAVLSGCRIERRLIDDGAKDRTIRVESGDRLYFDLDETADGGCRWDSKCDDSDVEVTIDHRRGKAEVRIRVHRGYDGPSTIYFFCKRRGVKDPSRTFTVNLYKRVGDAAFWE